MDKSWLKEIESIVEEESNKITRLIADREKKRKLKNQKTDTLKKIIRQRINEINNIVRQKEKVQDTFEIFDNGMELRITRSGISEVNSIDLLFIFDILSENLKLKVYNENAGERKYIAETEDYFEEFIMDTIKTFIRSWYQRRFGDELLKEKEYEVHVKSTEL